MEYKKRFRFNNKTLEYDFQLRKRRRWWWLLLLLLPLLLLIRWKSDIEVKVEYCNHEPVRGAEVEARYVEYALLCRDADSALKFSAKISHTFRGVTDTDGLVRFEGVKHSLYACVFHPRQKLHVEASCGGSRGETSFRLRRCKRRYVMQITDFWVHVIDLETGDDIPEAKLKVRGEGGKEEDAVTDVNGRTSICGLACGEAQIHISAAAAGYADTTVTLEDISEISARKPVVIRLRPIDVGYTCDVVMCFDNTGSMSAVINSVKRNIINFPDQLKDYCKSRGKMISRFRIKIIDFGDFGDRPDAMHVSDFYELPGQERKLQRAVNRIKMTHGGDDPEDALVAIATALQADWGEDGTRRRQIIVVYTDAESHPLGRNKTCPGYPAAIPESFDELTAQWNSIDKRTKRMILYAPSHCHYPWDAVETQWDCVTRKTQPLSSVFESSSYTDVLNAICESM